MNHEHAMHRLNMWAAERGGPSSKSAAAEVGISRAALFSYCTGLRRPSPQTARKIEEVTGTPRDAWFDWGDS